MSRSETATSLSLAGRSQKEEERPSLTDSMEKMDIHSLFGVAAERLPFSREDTTAGGEAELQAVVVGKKEDCDLPLTIQESHYFANINRRTAAGELPQRAVTDLERYIEENRDGVWENSWVRFPRALLGPLACRILQHDLLADKTDPAQGLRTDLSRFLFQHQGCEHLRVPISYLLKLALAEATDGQPAVIAATGQRLMDHFLSDNTSPETYSFYVCAGSPDHSVGKALAGETAQRFLLTQLLVQFANQRFGLLASGQRAMVYYSPHPPIRQKRLNDCISDAFYRELFMNPCLSGWNRGEQKLEYMHLCHRVLSRSQLNALAKLREAGIITRNLVVMPNPSNISLANNGTHISLGSQKLTALLQDQASGFTRREEKVLGDLILKINEHFLPLFVGTYTATPYRIDFSEFHPESVLGFLPHELDFTHLRMLWRRWQKKARLKILGQPVTPFGPAWLDRPLSRLFGLRGDFVPDFRLIDYLVALKSSEKSPALDGRLHNHDRLKQDLTEMGVFDKRMSLYLFNKLREFEAMGFSGFEGRAYSLFFSFGEDLARAVDLQQLLTALAFQYLAEGRTTHEDIPDNPFVESERRQIIFGRAIGLPTFFVRQDTGNLFLRRIVSLTPRVRPSRRYPGFLRVCHQEYVLALARIIEEDGQALIKALGMEDTIEDLKARLRDPERYSALGKLTGAILGKAGASSPLKMRAQDFNRAAEDFYREDLRRRHIIEGLSYLEKTLQRLEATPCPESLVLSEIIQSTANVSAHDSVREAGPLVTGETAPPDLLQRLIGLQLLAVSFAGCQAARPEPEKPQHDLRKTAALV